MSETEIVRILVVSHGAGAGKTSLIQRFLTDTFEHTYSETMGNIHSKKLTIDGEFVCVQILDTPGAPELSSIAEESMKFADAFMIVYSMADPSALQESVKLKFSIAKNSSNPNPPMILVGAKSDLAQRKKRKRTTQPEFAASMIARTWDCPFVETSAKRNVNVTDAFVELIRQHRANRQPILHEQRSLPSVMSNMFPCLRTWSTANASSSKSRVVKSGWLSKRGLVIPNWKRRFVVLYEDGTVQYFDDELEPSVARIPLGEFSLRDVWQIVEFGEDQDQEDGFVCQTADRDWYFGCVSETERDGWLDVIVRMIAQIAARRGAQMEAERLSSSTASSEALPHRTWEEENERNRGLSLMDQLSLSSAASASY